MRMARLLVPLALAALLGAACGGGGGENGGTDGNGGAAPVDSVSMVDNAFEPESFSVTSGGSLTVTNDGQALHSFTVTDADIDQDVTAGESATVDAPADAGDYDVICKYHPEMTATMTVA